MFAPPAAGSRVAPSLAGRSNAPVVVEIFANLTLDQALTEIKARPPERE